MVMMLLWHLYVDDVVMVLTPCVDDVDMVVVPAPYAENVNVVEVTTLCVDDDDVVSTFYVVVDDVPASLC